RIRFLLGPVPPDTSKEDADKQANRHPIETRALWENLAHDDIIPVKSQVTLMRIVQRLMGKELPEALALLAPVLQEIEKANAATEQEKKGGQDSGLPMHEQTPRQAVKET